MGTNNPQQAGGTHLESIEYDVQFDGILTSNRMIDLTCIGEGAQYHNRNDQEQGP